MRTGYSFTSPRAVGDDDDDDEHRQDARRRPEADPVETALLRGPPVGQEVHDQHDHQAEGEDAGEVLK